MSKVSMTVQQIQDLGLWDRVCEYKRWNPWILNEGQIDNNEVVEFDSEFKKEEEIIKYDSLTLNNGKELVKIYTWKDAPEFKYLGGHGGDEDWVIVVLESDYELNRLDVDNIVDRLTLCDYNEFTVEIDNTRFKVFVTAHA